VITPDGRFIASMAWICGRSGARPFESVPTLIDVEPAGETWLLHEVKANTLEPAVNRYVLIRVMGRNV